MVWDAIWTAGHSELVVCNGSVNISAFWTKGCCLHFIVASCIIVPSFSCKIELSAILQKTKDWLEKEGIKCLPWPSQSPDMSLIESL